MKKEEKYFKHYSGPKSSQMCLQLLNLFAPNTKEDLDTVYQTTKRGTNYTSNTAMLLDSDVGDSNSESNSAAKKLVLSTEDRFLLQLKLKDFSSKSN